MEFERVNVDEIPDRTGYGIYQKAMRAFLESGEKAVRVKDEGNRMYMGFIKRAKEDGAPVRVMKRNGYVYLIRTDLSAEIGGC